MAPQVNSPSARALHSAPCLSKELPFSAACSWHSGPVCHIVGPAVLPFAVRGPCAYAFLPACSVTATSPGRAHLRLWVSVAPGVGGHLPHGLQVHRERGLQSRVSGLWPITILWASQVPALCSSRPPAASQPSSASSGPPPAQRRADRCVDARPPASSRLRGAWARVHTAAGLQPTGTAVHTASP